jgi:hypothetical protein
VGSVICIDIVQWKALGNTATELSRSTEGQNFFYQLTRYYLSRGTVFHVFTRLKTLISMFRPSRIFHAHSFIQGTGRIDLPLFSVRCWGNCSKHPLRRYKYQRKIVLRLLSRLWFPFSDDSWDIGVNSIPVGSLLGIQLRRLKTIILKLNNIRWN